MHFRVFKTRENKPVRVQKSFLSGFVIIRTCKQLLTLKIDKPMRALTTTLAVCTKNCGRQVFSLLLFLLCWTGLSFGQEKTDDSKPRQVPIHAHSFTQQFPDLFITYKGIIEDSITSERLPGAILIVTSPSGMVHVNEAGTNGEFSFSTLREDNQTMEVSLLGYHIKHMAIPPLDPGKAEKDLGVIQLVPDIQEIDAVEVKTRAMFFRINGDTLIYNPSLFRTRAGASALELISALPGAEVSERGVKIGGKTVERTYVNGETLYGKEDPLAALKYLRADEIRQILAYDEIDEASAQVNGRKNARRRRVLNMLTFRPIQTSIDFNAMAGGGADLNQKQIGKGRYLGELDFKYFSFKRRISLEYMGNNLGISNSAFGYNRIGSQFESMDAASSAREGESREHSVSASWTELLGLSELCAAYSFNDNRHSVQNILHNDYFPTNDYRSRIYGDTATNRSTRSQHTGFLSLNRETGKSTLKASVSATFDDNTQHNRTTSLLSVDDNILNRQTVQNQTRDNGYDLTSMVQYFLNFGKRFGLNTLWNLSIRDHDTDEVRLDTLSSSTGHYLIGMSGDGTATNLNGNITFFMTPSEKNKKTGKGGTLNLGYTLRYNRSRSNQMAVDRFSGIVDPTLTFRYTNSIINHLPGIQWNCNSSKNNISLSLKASISRLLRDERVPLSPQAQQDFFALEPNIMFSHSFAPMKLLSIGYSLSHSLPSLEMVSDKLNTENPLLLQGGNPNLKQSYSNNINITYNSFNQKKQSTFSISANAQIMGREHVFRQQFFSEATFLPQYDYTTQPGATLTTVANSSRTTLTARFGTSFNTPLTPLRSMLYLEAGYNYAQSPSYLGERLATGYRHMPELKLALQSNFSQKISIKLFSVTGFKYETTSDKNYDRAIDARAGIDLKADFGTRLFFGTAYEHHTYRSYVAAVGDFHANVWNAFLGCRVMKDNRSEFRLSVFDILNQNRNFVATMYVDHIANQWKQLYARYFTLSFFYRFHKTK